MLTRFKSLVLKSFNTKLGIKSYSNTKSHYQEVRVRFAPSPTGYLHLGGLRTALYNYLYAKSHNGKFILRIEDTDQNRIIPGAVARLEDDLNWAGIHPDESPIEGGPFGPYIQSERLHLYRDNVGYLLSTGAAYKCFCSDRRLDLLRREALRTQQVPRYDNKCRDLSPSEVDKKLSAEEKYCVRFKLLSKIDFTDLVYGHISSDSCHQEGDPVILKTDGFPTYHLANVVDDHAMKISHVLRGVEWQISTQKHIQLYRAFGWQCPKFAHLPLILNADGSKLSKRQGDVQLEHYRTDGIFPLALFNYVTDAGGGFVRSTAKPCCLTTQQLAECFDLSLINVNSCRLMPEKLLQFNALELGRQVENSEQLERLTAEVKQLVVENFEDRLENSELQLQDRHIQSVLRWACKRIQRLRDLVNKDMAFLWVLPNASSATLKELSVDILEDLRASLDATSNVFVKQDNLKTLLKEFSSRHNVPFNKLMKYLRYTLSGLKSLTMIAVQVIRRNMTTGGALRQWSVTSCVVIGRDVTSLADGSCLAIDEQSIDDFEIYWTAAAEGPGVAEMMTVLGRDSTIARLDRIINLNKT